MRTALVFTGVGTAGAYHAGVLRALQEAGVKIDLVAGRGVGVVGAMFAAIDGGSRLWETDGAWQSPDVARLYRWRGALRASAWALAVALMALAVPLMVVVGGVMVYPLGFLLRLVGAEAGERLAAGYAQVVDAIFHPAVLPMYLPRFVTVALLVLLGILVVSAVRSRLRAPHRRSRGALWWRLLGAPLDVRLAVDWFSASLSRTAGGAASDAMPGASGLADRYAELLIDNAGQPGFRELLVLTHDLDARRDLIAAYLSEPHRRTFFLRRLGEEGAQRHLETLDLADAGRAHVADVFAAGLSLPVMTDPRLVRFPPDSHWRGEVHRICDRPDATARLLEEVACAGAEQVILVSALTDPRGPHTLAADRRDARGRASEHLASMETASIRDAVSARGGLFQAVFTIRPTHNPVGPLDFEGCYDERSDRRRTVAELLDQGYDDGCRQFVDSVVGASGEWIEASPRGGTTPVGHETG